MKILVTLLIIYISTSNIDSDDYSIIGMQNNCQTGMDDSRERYITLKRNDSIIATNIKTRFGEFKIKNLRKGEYTLEYFNVFGQTCKKNIELLEKTTNIEICTNEFLDTHEKTFFDNVKNETLYIKYSSQGCFHSDRENFQFYNTGKKIVGELRIGKKTIKKTLHDNDLEYLSLFERKVRHIKNGMGGCTTSDSYTFEMKNEKALLVIDDTCDWSGFDEMKKEIFGISQ